MSHVEAVRGPLEPAALGKTLMHEHVFVVDDEMRRNDPGGWNEAERIADATSKLRALKAAGIDTIVDPTVIGLGRDVSRIARVNASADINILVATGLYTYDEVPFYFKHRTARASGGRDPLVTLFVRDLTRGIGDTGVKAAFLKCAIDAPGMTRGVARVMRAVARAHRETGAPIVVHTSVANRSALLVHDLLAEVGVSPERVVLAHSGDSPDLDFLERLIDAGFILGMDRFGLDALLPFEARVTTVARLCERGYAERLVLSHDAACFIDWFTPEARAALGAHWHYTHIVDHVLPALRARGVEETAIHTMLVGNPRRFFFPREKRPQEAGNAPGKAH